MDAPLSVLLGVGAAFVLIAAGVALGLRARSRKRQRVWPEAWSPDPQLADGHRPPDGGALSNQLLGLVRQVADARGAALLMATPEGFRVTMLSAGSAHPAQRLLALKEGLLGIAFESEREITADPVHPQSLGFLPESSGPVSLALVPYSHRGRVRGVLACHRSAGRPFREEEMALLRRCVVLLDGWETMGAHWGLLMKAHDQADRLARGVASMLGEKDPLDIAERAVEALFDLLPAVYGFVMLYSKSTNMSGLFVKPSRLYEPPQSFQPFQRNTWSHWLYERPESPSLYLEGATSRETAMPVLCQGEPFPAGAVTFLVPLEASGERFGVAGLVGKPDAHFGEQDRATAERFLRQASAILMLAMLNRFNQDNSIMDGLTGVHNRRHFDECLDKELERSRRTSVPAALILMDIDHFKRINDTYGHDMGDQVLRAVAQSVKGALRSLDIICRYGGEEFIVILPSCTLAEARAVAERARQSLANLPTGPGGAIPEPITLSAGVSAFPSPCSTPSGLLKAADTALYDAKRRGRNRVVVAS